MKSKARKRPLYMFRKPWKFTGFWCIAVWILNCIMKRNVLWHTCGPMWLLKSNLLFLGGWKEEGFSQLQKNATYMNFKWKRFSVSSLFLELTLDQEPIFQLGLQSTTWQNCWVIGGGCGQNESSTRNILLPPCRTSWIQVTLLVCIPPPQLLEQLEKSETFHLKKINEIGTTCSIILLQCSSSRTIYVSK